MSRPRGPRPKARRRGHPSLRTPCLSRPQRGEAWLLILLPRWAAVRLPRGLALPRRGRRGSRAGHRSVGDRRREAGRILRVIAQLVDEECQFGDVPFVGGLLDQVEHFLDAGFDDGVR